MQNGPAQNVISDVACRHNTDHHGVYADVNSRWFQNADSLGNMELSDNRPYSSASAGLRRVDKPKRFAVKRS